MKNVTTLFRMFLLAATLLLFAACQTTYYAAWEKLGKEKRHLLKDQVEKVRNEQEDASEQFKDVLTRIKEMYGFSGGELESFYDRLKSDYETCEDRAQAVRERIGKVEQIAEDLFAEWEGEIDDISNVKLKSKSMASMKSTQSRFNRLHRAMIRATAGLTPVLKDLNDYVLYLKHNLNAQSIGVLKQEMLDIEAEVGQLLSDMGTSISEADEFLKHFE